MWAAIARPERYLTWWPWLRFDARSLDVGERWKCRVRSPLGHQLRFDVTLRSVSAVVLDRRHAPGTDGVAHMVDTAALTAHRPDRGFVRGVVSGDIAGTAALSVEHASSVARSGAERTLVRLASDLEATGRALQLISGTSPPLARWCHDRVIERGIEQFDRVVGVPPGRASRA